MNLLCRIVGVENISDFTSNIACNSDVNILIKTTKPLVEHATTVSSHTNIGVEYTAALSKHFHTREICFAAGS